MITLKAAEVHTYTQSDGYITHYRLWGASNGTDVVVLLHGGMSHSEWQAPLAEAILSRSEISFIATDRRGSGLNNVARGHMDSQEEIINDVVEFLQSLKKSFTRVHLAGWCFGAQIASVVAAQISDQDILSSLILIAPGFFFNERYSDVLRLSIESVHEAIAEFNVTPELTRAYIPLPLQPTDFTVSADWQQFIMNDPLRLIKVTDGTVHVSGEIAERAELSFPHIGNIPLLVVFGTKDKLVDVERVREFVTRDKSPIVVDIETGHAVQFEQPEKLAETVLSFLSEVG